MCVYFGRVWNVCLCVCMILGMIGVYLCVCMCGYLGDVPNVCVCVCVFVFQGVDL